ncbi:MAG: hypothetical protein WBD40_05555, partial [Tepidisphaeraceae bacterium]
MRYSNPGWPETWFAFEHTDPSLNLTFKGSGMQDEEIDAWRVDVSHVYAYNPDAAIYAVSDAQEGPPGWGFDGGFRITRTHAMSGFTLEPAKVRWQLDTGRDTDPTNSDARLGRNPSDNADYYFDFPAGSSHGVAQFDAGQTEVFVPIVKPINDTHWESPESVRIKLVDGVHYDLYPDPQTYPGQAKAKIFIFDDDGGPGPWDPEWYPPEDPPPPPLPDDPDDSDPDFTGNITIGGKGGDDAGTTDPDDAPGGPVP